MRPVADLDDLSFVVEVVADEMCVQTENCERQLSHGTRREINVAGTAECPHLVGSIPFEATLGIIMGAVTPSETEPAALAMATCNLNDPFNRKGRSARRDSTVDRHARACCSQSGETSRPTCPRAFARCTGGSCRR